MSGSVSTFIPSGVATTVVLPASVPLKLPTSLTKSPQSATKSRIKNTPRRGNPPGSTVCPITPREPSLYTQASRNVLNTVPAVARPVPTPSVPALRNSQPCNVLVVSEAPPSRVTSVPANSQTPNFIPNAELSKTKTRIACTKGPVAYTTANSTQPKTSVEIKPEAVASPFHIKPKPATIRQKPVVLKNKPVLPKVQTPNSVMIDLVTPTSSSESTNFIIPSHTLSFQPDSVVTPTSVGYTINITDILPPKPNQQNCANSPPKLKPLQRVNTIGKPQALPPLSTITPGAQLPPKDAISVKSQSEMIAPQPVSSQTSYFQLQASDPDDIPTVIPITIIGPGQQQITIDQNNAQILSQVLPQLVPFQTLAPTPSPSQGAPKLDKLPDGMEDATVESVDVVEIVDVAEDDATLRVRASNMGEIHHGLTKSVPEPYVTHFLSELTSESSLPAISCSQISSVLSALDTPHESDNVFHERVESPRDDRKKPPLLRRAPRKPQSQSKPVTRQKKRDEEEAKKKEDRLNATNKLVEKVQCFKCRFCLFLTLDQAAVTKHIEEEHSSHLSKSDQNNSVIPCPGCNNVFVSEKSLSVHLSEDHKVARRELNDIMSTLTGAKEDTGDELPKKARVPREKAKKSTRTSAKIRVRNLMKDAASAEEAGCEAANFEIPSPTHSPEDESTLEDKPNRQIDRDYDDHDYATVATDSDNENVKKKRKRKRGAISRKKRKVNAENEDESSSKKIGYKCNVSFCAVRMTSYDNLVYHQRCHKKNGQTDAKMTEGTDAKTPQETKSSAEADMKSPNSRKTEYLCPECHLVLKSWVQMSGHLWRNHGIDMELHSCDQCDYKTPSLANLVNLHQRIHGSERPFSCDACEKSFKTTKQLRNHKVIHTNKIKAAAGEACACDLCGRSFIDTRLLRSHIRAVHNKLRPFNCPTCGYSASNRSTLKMHLRLHTGEKPFHCDECSYITADHNSLRRHKKRHSGDKPYKCPHCFYACIQSSTYKVHLRTKHPGQGEGLMYSCQSCPFHSVSQDIYRSHVAEHKSDEGITKKNGGNGNAPSARKRKARIRANKDGNSSHAIATAAVSEPLPIILTFSSEEALASEAPNMQDVVEEVSEAIIPGSDLHLLYSNFVELNHQQPTETTGVVYNSQTSDFVMSVLTDSVIQVVDERNAGTPILTIAEECITGDLGELQENTEDLKFKLCEEVRS